MWCRETLATCRRPLGINCFDLTLEIATRGRPARTIKLSRVDPGELWGPGHLEAGLAKVLATPTAGPSGMNISATLFSWGEAAHRAVKW